MNIVNLISIVFILRVTHYTAGQRSDKILSSLHSQLSRQLFYRRYGWTLQYSPDHERPLVAKRRLDRFRFFHKGIGKRSTESRISDVKSTAVDKEKPNFFKQTKTLLKNMHVFQKRSPQYHFLKKPDLFMENAKMLRMLFSLSYLFHKRTPEFFSETLYPIQAGKQQLEVTLDKTLDKNVKPFGNSLLHIDENNGNFERNASVKPDMKHNTLKDETESEFDGPFQLMFVSSDLNTYSPSVETLSKGDARNQTGGMRAKKWWAPEMFSRFRSPKSWNRNVKTARHVDPALYFMGLGR